MIYLDHAASAPLRISARDAWVAAASEVGNASSVHGSGQAARRLLEDAREAVARRLGCEPIEVVFTGGGTESINLALKGLWWARAAGRDAVVLPDGEHHATLDTVAALDSSRMHMPAVRSTASTAVSVVGVTSITGGAAGVHPASAAVRANSGRMAMSRICTARSYREPAQRIRASRASCRCPFVASAAPPHGPSLS